MKNNKGFTLVEIIISIAVLSILCVIFLQLFVKASDISDRAQELDKSVTITNSTIEIVKNVGNLNDIKASKYFKDFDIIESSEGVTVTKTFNDAFVYDDEDIKYRMSLTLTKSDIIINSTIKLYNMTCEVVKEETNKVLYVAESQIILE